MEFFKTISIEEGKKKIYKNIKKYNIGFEEVSILESKDRILFKDIVSHENIPDFNRSTVDGYAINSRDSHGSSNTIPSVLKLIETIEIGKIAKRKLQRGEVSYVPTGGMVPEGADGVIMIEVAEKLDDESILIYKPISKGENLVLEGEDIKYGDIIIPEGKKITSHHIGLLASQGIESVKVFKKIKIAVISTGDELIDLDERLERGKIRDINSYVISARVNELGGEVVERKIISDNYELLKEGVENSLKVANIVILSGGSSVGTKDYTYDILNSFDGEGVFIHGVSVKPGKPTIVGMAGEKIVFGLPGHPSSSIIIFNIFVKYAMDKMRKSMQEDRVAYCIMDSNFPSSPGKKTYQMVKTYENDGDIYASPIFGKSGTITLLSKADGYIEIEDKEEGICKGERRKVIYF